ncbi:MAG: TatD family hydrolase [Gammaproteobacteria bacterium]
MPAAKHLLIDSHCHPHFPQLAGLGDSLVAEMTENGVSGALAVATSLADAVAVKDLTKAHPDVFYAACGVHPLTDESADDDEAAIIKCCDDDNVVAIGETGLDFFRGRESEKMQRRRFAAHIAAARKLNKPLIIHTRDSLPETLDMLAAEKAQDCGGVLHCYGGDAEGIGKAANINFVVSFTGIVSFKNAAEVRAAVKAAPADGYMVETDAPYLAPAPHRGKVCTPAMVRHVAKVIAAIRHETYNEVVKQTTETFTRLFLSRA